MPKSGPKELAAYHQQQMDKETPARMTPKTMMPHETLDAEAIAAAQQRLDDMNLPGTGIAPALMNGVNGIQQEAQATLRDALPSRKERADKGKERGPDLWIACPGVKFDLSVHRGREAFIDYMDICGKHEDTAAIMHDGILGLLTIVDRLLKKHGVQ